MDAGSLIGSYRAGVLDRTSFFYALYAFLSHELGETLIMDGSLWMYLTVPGYDVYARGLDLRVLDVSFMRYPVRGRLRSLESVCKELGYDVEFIPRGSEYILRVYSGGCLNFYIRVRLGSYACMVDSCIVPLSLGDLGQYSLRVVGSSLSQVAADCCAVILRGVRSSRYSVCVLQAFLDLYSITWSDPRFIQDEIYSLCSSQLGWDGFKSGLTSYFCNEDSILREVPWGSFTVYSVFDGTVMSLPEFSWVYAGVGTLFAQFSSWLSTGYLVSA